MRALGNVTIPRVIVKSFTHNLGLKLFAFSTAILLFSLVHSEEEARRTVIVDVVALLPQPRSGKLLVSELPTQIKVTLKGSRSRIRAIQREDLLPVQMDLTDGAVSYYYFDPSTVELPAGVDIVQVEPSTVFLTWAKATDKIVPVRARLTGSLTSGLEIKPTATSVPAEVTLRGPEDEMRAIFEVRAASIALDGLAEGTHERLVPIEPLPPNVKCLEETVVRVRFGIVPVKVERTFYGLSVTVPGHPKALLRPSKVTVTVRGPATLLSQMDAKQVVPSVDLSQVKVSGAPSPQVLTVNGLPDGVEVVRTTPPDVLVKIR